MATTGEDIQAAFVAYLKTKTIVTSLLANASPVEVREAEWQGTDFLYPNIRISVDMVPQECGPYNADITIDTFSGEKSSKQAVHISAILTGLLHKRSFTSLGLRFSTVRVMKVNRPDRSIVAWLSQVNLFVQVT